MDEYVDEWMDKCKFYCNDEWLKNEWQIDKTTSRTF